MTENFKKLMREQVQEKLNDFLRLAQEPIPKNGWVRTIRNALGMSSYALARRLKCSQSNIATIEQREKKGDISLRNLTTSCSCNEL